MNGHPSQESSDSSSLSPPNSQLGGSTRLSDLPMSAGCMSVLLSRLQGVKKTTEGWQARCPAHKDSNPSLSIKEVADGTILVHCFAGCTAQEVVQAVGLELKDLYPTDSTNNSRKRQVAAEYIYLDANKNPALKVLRYKPKDFRQQRWDGTDWSWQDQKPKLLYRLPELLAETQRHVFVGEGEKDADKLVGLGLLATCNPGGAGKWLDQYSEVLSERSVILLPDNDKAGRADVLQKVESLLRHQCKVRVVELPGLAEQGRCLGLAPSGTHS